MNPITSMAPTIIKSPSTKKPFPCIKCLDLSKVKMRLESSSKIIITVVRQNHTENSGSVRKVISLNMILPPYINSETVPPTSSNFGDLLITSPIS